jgi:hypothetical protein
MAVPKKIRVLGKRHGNSRQCRRAQLFKRCGTTVGSGVAKMLRQAPRWPGVFTRRCPGFGLPLCRQGAQQRLRLLQIARVETFGKPAVNRSQQFARLLHLALVTSETREAHGGAEFKGLRLLLACD